MLYSAPGGVGGGWGVSEALEGFVTSLAGGSVVWASSGPYERPLFNDFGNGSRPCLSRGTAHRVANERRI
jgi:hypothetical protein